MYNSIDDTIENGGESMNEHRGAGRRHLYYYLEIDDANSGEMIGRLGDISNNGLLLIAERAYPSGEVLDLEIKIPDDLDALKGIEHSTLRLSCKTRWSKQEDNPNIYCNGCEILDLDDEKRAVIHQLFHAIGFRDI